MDPFAEFEVKPDGLAQRAANQASNGASYIVADPDRIAQLEAELAALKAGAQSEAMAPNLGEIEPIVPLFGSERYKPHVLLQKELPHHRQICQLFAKGHTPTEVAQMTGFTNVTVNDVRKQPWALKYIAELMEKMGRKAVESELQGATLDAARTMIKVMKGEIEGVKPCDQIKAAKEILDRQYGTAPANPPMEKVDLNDVTDEELVQTIRGQNN